MSTPWRNLPPLAALRAFDATARHGGFAGAGRVLNVTHAAVTQQVRALEAELGVPLVRRVGRTVCLTEAGERLARAMNEGFGTIAAGVDDLRRTEGRRPLRVATTTFIAEAWILPRLPEFWALHPGIEVAMSPSRSLSDLARDGFDMAIRALSEGWIAPASEEVRPLVQTPLLAVCAPSLLAEGTRDPASLPWIMETRETWDQAQLRSAGIDPDTLHHVSLGSAHLEMSAARRGLGVVLATEIIARADIEAGRLVVLPIGPLATLTYVAAMPKGHRRAAVECFADWLQSIF